MRLKQRDKEGQDRSGNTLGGKSSILLIMIKIYYYNIIMIYYINIIVILASVAWFGFVSIESLSFPLERLQSLLGSSLRITTKNLTD